MFIFENLKMALESIKSNKMRSFLTMLGIIIGIASVIIIVSVGAGAQNYITSQFESVGSTMVILNVDEKEASESDYFTMEDIHALKDMADYVYTVTPLYQTYGDATFKDQNREVLVAGGFEGVESLDNVELVSGRFYNSDDVLSSRKVAVIDEITARKFFGTTDVVGMDINVTVWEDRMVLKIVGVSKSQMGEFASDLRPGVIYMPISTFIEVTNLDNTFKQVYMQSTDRAYTEIMGNTAVSFMEGRHSNRGRNIYTAQNMLGEMDMITNILGLVQTFITAVAAISLLVGGIGVMNIMLVSVTERTREIGIRKALGAKTNSILFQFLTESAILTFIGGLIGLGIGFLGAVGLSSLAGITPVFTMQAILFTLAFSAGVGLFFGIYPAKKAAQLHPIEALRHD